MTDLFNKHKDKITKNAKSYFQNPSDAEDAIQEAHIKLHSLRIAEADNEEAYVVRICTNLFRDIYRRNKRIAELDVMASIEDGIDYDDPLALLLEERIDDEVSVRLEDLPEDLRVVSRMYYLQGMSYGAIAEALNMGIGTVGSRLHRARKFFSGE